MLFAVAPGVVDVERRAVVDQPHPPVPDEHVRVLRRPIGVGDERVEPDDVGGPVRIRHRVGGGIERERPGQEVQADVPADARDQQVVDLLVRLRVGDLSGEIDADEVRHEEAERPTDLAGQPLRDECPRPLSGAAELDDV